MLFESTSAEALESLKRQVQAQQPRFEFAMDQMAIDFLEGRQRDHINSELQLRFPESMSGGGGQEIQPVTLPLVERFVAEQANAYNKPVARYFVTEEGERNDATRAVDDQLKKALDLARYDETMASVDRMMVLHDPAPCVLWYQVKRGRLRPVLYLPSQVVPIVPENRFGFDATDPDDHDGFLVMLQHTGPESLGGKQLFAIVTAGSVVYAEGTPEDWRKVETFDNPITWSQVHDVLVDGQMRTMDPQDLPLMPLTFWHSRKPLMKLLPEPGYDIVWANVEANMLITSLFDHIRTQGFDIPWKKVANPTQTSHIQKHGARKPVVLGMEEDFGFSSSSARFTELLDVAKDYTTMVALMKRLSSNDFTINGVSPASGWAKEIDSWPKIEARDERLSHLRPHEEQVAAPRIVANLIYIGEMDEAARQLKMRAQFHDVEFPKSIDEKNKADEFDLKENLTTRAEILARRHGISIDEAKERLERNTEDNGAGKQPEPPPQPQAGGLFANLGRIGRASS